MAGGFTPAAIRKATCGISGVTTRGRLRESTCRPGRVRSSERHNRMYELHENEQYFFHEETIRHLSQFLSRWRSPCCICAPLLGQRLAAEGVQVRILDIDDRFEATPGYKRFDLHRPQWLGESFDIILCDPPFYSISLSRLFSALRTLSRNDFRQKLMIGYLKRRESAALGTFAKFQLKPSGYFPKYQTVQRVSRNDIEFFSNLEQDELEILNAVPSRADGDAARANR